jgi:catechol 2,3-dioxygenase-like lactoylglutathione lyase family enzyme
MTTPQRLTAPLVPELDVTNLDDSLRFYVGVVGFGVVFDRRPERFAYLALEGAELMLQEAAGPGRRFRTATLERPFGRGINLQIAVGDVDAVFASVLRSGVKPVVPVEDRWYDVEVGSPAGRWNTRGPVRAGNRQFVVADPDGYLLRFFTSLGVEPR